MDLQNSEVNATQKLLKRETWIKKNLLLVVTLSGVCAGLIAGTYLRRFNFSSETILLISYPGEIFFRTLKLLTLPMLMSCLINVSANLDARTNGKIVLRTIVYFIVTNILTVSMAIGIAMIFQPGDLNLLKNVPAIEVKENSKLLDSILDLGRNIFPDNLFQATFQQTFTKYVPANEGISIDTNKSLVEPKMIREVTTRNGVNTIGLVVFCLAFGAVLNTIGERGDVLKHFFSALFEIVLKMVSLVIWLSGFGVASIITAKLLSIDDLLEVTSQLAVFIFCVVFGLALQQLVLLPAIYFLFLRKNPYTFLIALVEPWTTGFAVSSSAITLPTTLRCMNQKLKSDPRISNFVLTIGITLNSSGAALFLAMASIFIARLSGAILEFSDLVVILLVSTTTSMSLPSVPSASLVMLFIILSAINVGTENIPLLFTVDWLLDRFRTTSNVLDDCFAAAVIEKLSKKDLTEMDLNKKGVPDSDHHKLLKTV